MWTKDNRTPAGSRARVRILATSDLHMQLTGHDYYADRPAPGVGLTRTASLIAAARAEAEADDALVLLFDNGDGLQGTPLGDLAAERTGRAHPLMRAFAHLRYDAVGLGNHDFNFGLRQLGAALRHAPCPVLCSNLRWIGPRRTGSITPFAILDRIVRHRDGEHPIRIGILSFIPPQTVTWDAQRLHGLIEVDDIPDSARRWMPELRRAGCDLVVALAHTGLSGAPASQGMENAAVPLAGVEGIDAVIAGHTHLHLPGTAHRGLDNVDAATGAVHGKPMVMPGSSGSHLGVIDLALEKRATGGGWRVAKFTSALRAVATRGPDGRMTTQVGEDPALAALLAEDHAETRTLMRQPVGQGAEPLHSYFTFFAPDRALALVAAAQAAALRPMLPGTAGEGLALLSAAAPGKFGARAGPEHFTDVPAGPLSLRHVADLHVFPNDLRAVVLTGGQVLDWLERAASLFRQIRPGQRGQMLVDPAMPGHDFDVLHGLRYAIDLSAPARFNPDGTRRTQDSRRIREAEWNGAPLDPCQRFVVALNSHRANGGGHVSALAGVERLDLPPMTIRAAIRDYVAGRLPRDPLADTPPPWRFVPMPGAGATVLTGPRATAHLAELAGRNVDVDGCCADGFLRLAVPL